MAGLTILWADYEIFGLGYEVNKSWKYETSSKDIQRCS